MAKQTFPVGKRRPRNEAEGCFYDRMISEGWEISKQGFPDFACYKGDKVIFVEIKPKRSHRLKREQYKVMVALSRFGVPCYRWSPEDNIFHQITPDIY